MLNDLFANTTIPVLEQVVNFSQARHNVLAGNVANMDTPGYKVRDLSVDTFQARLKEAVEAKHAGPKSQSPSEAAYKPSAAQAMEDVKESMKSILYHDDSNDGLDQQVAEILKNQTQHNTAIAVMRSQFSLLQAAISERV
ncbi:MAG: flagellar basal body rod protein FlgB [Planctomycetota bacterium]|nr:MAG: flagellar basal body rod protein FlgB [Planctomycetota bacterium]